MEDIGMPVLGILISVLGLVNLSGNISTIHGYHRRRVAEEDIPAYGKVMGAGTLIIGLALIVAWILAQTAGMPEDWVILPAFAAGIIILLYGQFRYNKGLF